MLLTVDTLEFAVANIECNELLYYLGIENLPFEYSGKFRFNYKSSLYSGGIIVGFDNDTTYYSCYVVMSGKGCRTLESLFGGSEIFNWYDYLLNIFNLDVSIRRIDIACDTYDNKLSVGKCIKYYNEGKFASKTSHVEGTLFSKSEFQVGSGKSNMLVRIYDKALERGYKDSLIDGHPWIRCEMQLRDEYAFQFVQEWLLSTNLGLIYKSHLIAFFRFLTQKNDKKNSQRIPTAKFWSDFTDNLAGIRFSSAPGVEYNYSKTERYILNQAASSVKTFALYNNLTPEQLYARLVKSDSVKLNSDQLGLLKAKESELPWHE